MKLALSILAGAILISGMTPIKAQASAPAASLQEQTKPQAKTFTGTIKKVGDNYVLNETSSKMTYTLDDAEKASQFEGKQVKVVGTFDEASNMIHVQTIQEAA
jgi:hypothetical protein